MLAELSKRKPTQKTAWSEPKTRANISVLVWVLTNQHRFPFACFCDKKDLPAPTWLCWCRSVRFDSCWWRYNTNYVLTRVLWNLVFCTKPVGSLRAFAAVQHFPHVFALLPLHARLLFDLWLRKKSQSIIWNGIFPQLTWSPNMNRPAPCCSQVSKKVILRDLGLRLPVKIIKFWLVPVVHSQNHGVSQENKNCGQAWPPIF